MGKKGTEEIVSSIYNRHWLKRNFIFLDIKKVDVNTMYKNKKEIVERDFSE